MDLLKNMLLKTKFSILFSEAQHIACTEDPLLREIFVYCYKKQSIVFADQFSYDLLKVSRTFDFRTGKLTSYICS